MNAPRIDWTQIINDLVGMGISLAEISSALKVAPGTPYRWLEGSEPLYSNGALLLAMHAQRVEIHHGEGDTTHPRARKHLEIQGENDERAGRDPSSRTRKASGWR